MTKVTTTLQDALNNLAILSEILVDVSKSHITPSEAIEDIRKLGIASIYKVMSKQTELLELYREKEMQGRGSIKKYSELCLMIYEKEKELKEELE